MQHYRVGIYNVELFCGRNVCYLLIILVVLNNGFLLVESTKMAHSFAVNALLHVKAIQLTFLLSTVSSIQPSEATKKFDTAFLHIKSTDF